MFYYICLRFRISEKKKLSQNSIFESNVARIFPSENHSILNFQFKPTAYKFCIIKKKPINTSILNENENQNYCRPKSQIHG